MEKFFKIKAYGSNVRTEVYAGLTTFMAMAYILMVNAGMFADPFGNGTNVLGVSYGAIYIATAISSIVGTLLIGLMAKLPLAQASGMGLNAFFVYTVCIEFGLTYANALTLVLLDGIVFIILTATGLRKIIFSAIPDSVKKAIPAGIGLFIAFLGMQNLGLVVHNDSTLVNMVSFNLFGGNATWQGIMPILVGVIALMLIAALSARKVKGAVLWGILGGAVLYYGLGLLFTPDFYATAIAPNLQMNPLQPFADFWTQALGKVFTEGFDYSAYLATHSAADLAILITTTALAFCMVDMFDTLGTLYGAATQGGLLDENGDVRNMNKAMLSDAIATATGAICGTSTVTTVVESSAGVAEGGKTGLTSVVTATMFFIAMFLSPVAQLIPGCATASALIYVGVLMMGGLTSIEWNDISIAVPSFLTMAMMPFTYNISYGIAFGLIAHVMIMLFSGRIKETKISTWVLTVLFILMFGLTH